MIASLQGRHRDLLRRQGLVVRIEPQGRFRREAHERAHGVASLALGCGFKKLAQFNHGQQHCRRLIIEVHGPRHRVNAHEAKNGVHQAVDEGSARAHGHQAVHGRSLAQQCADAVHIEMPSKPDNGQAQKKLYEHEGARRGMGIHPVRQAEPHHVPHGHHEQGHSKADHGHKTTQALACILERFGLVFGKLGGCVVIGSRGGAEAQRGHAIHDLVLHRFFLAGAGPHFGLGGGKVDADFLHAFHTADHTLDAGRAGRAVHSAYVEFQGACLAGGVVLRIGLAHVFLRLVIYQGGA